MRKITVLSMITLDGVLQATGGRKEDPSGGFKYGGWVSPFGDEAYNKAVQKALSRPTDFLLGRKTFKISDEDWQGKARTAHARASARAEEPSR